MKINNSKGTVWLLLSLLGAAGCATAGPHRPHPSILSQELRDGLLSGLRKRNERVQSLKGSGRIHFGASGKGRPIEAAVILKRPYSLRIDFLSEGGASLFQLAAFQGDLWVYWPGKNTYFHGLASSEDLGRFLSVSLRPELAILLMSGVIPLEEEGRYTLLERPLEGEEGGEYVLESERGEIVLEKRGDDYLPLQYTALDLGGDKDYRVTYGDYRMQKGHWFPHRMDFRFWGRSFVSQGARKMNVQVIYRDSEINSSVDTKLFRIRIPEDAARIED